jgi:hypothetical protein
MPSDAVKAWAQVLAHWGTAAGFIAIAATLFLNWRNYAQQNRQKRAEFYFKLWDQVRTPQPGRLDICEVIDAGQWKKLSEISVRERRQKFLFFEQVALLVNSKLIHPHIAHYMFGYHAIRCWDHDEFWGGLPPKSLLKNPSV